MKTYKEWLEGKDVGDDLVDSLVDRKFRNIKVPELRAVCRRCGNKYKINSLASFNNGEERCSKCGGQGDILNSGRYEF